MKLSSTDLLGLERAGLAMFQPIEQRTAGAWTALVSAVPNRRANAIYPLGAPPDRLDSLLSLFAVHDRRIRCKVAGWIADDVVAAIESLSLRPVYGAHVMAAPARRVPDHDEVIITDVLDARWLSVNRDLPPAAAGGYGAHGTSLVAARIDDVAVGMAVITGEWSGIAAMYTHPGHRRQGHGSRILERLMGESHLRGATRCFLQVVESNLGGIRLYRAAGFETVGAYDYWE